jgi:2-amino-4-hydroxy-6-hydroxymethyldihydropteridine diphosphokinase
MITAYIGLGSNLEQPAEQLRQAVTAIEQVAGIELVGVSSLYHSKPMGPQDQPDYINAVVAITTRLKAIDLLDALQTIENDAGRVRKERWGARVLDLDILLYGMQTISSERLTIPHYGLKEREFVVYPLLEIAPHLVLPDGSRLNDIKNNLSTNGLSIYNADK